MTVEIRVSGAGDEDEREDKCDRANDKLCMTLLFLSLYTKYI